MKNFSPLILLALLPTAVSAQTSHPAHKEKSVQAIINGNEADSLSIYKAFEENSPAAYNIPDAPRFAIIGKNHSFYLGIGGSLKGTLSYDFGDPIDNPNNFVTADIPMHPAPGNNKLFQLSAMQSSIFVNFVALPDNPNKIGAYFSFNLNNGNYGFNLMYAYLKYRGFTVGYDYSLFADMAAAPPTIDYEGPCAFTSIPNSVIDYRHTFGKHFSLGAGLELPQASYTNSASTATQHQYVPDIPLYVQWAFNGNTRIRLSGMLRNIAYRDLAAAKNRNAFGWGIKLSGTAGLAPNLLLYYQAAYGKGMTSYFQDLNGGGLDLAPTPGKAGHLSAVEAWGGYLGAQYNFSEKIYASATYSYLRNYAKRYDGGATPWADQYKYAQYAVANVFYDINSFLTCGLEYIYGSRTDMSGLTHHDNRLQTMLQFNF